MARKREQLEPNPGDKRYIRRDEEGKFTDDQVDVGRSLSQDRQRDAQTESESGQGDKGDRSDAQTESEFGQDDEATRSE
jgi:hypothetical protein